MSDSPAAFYDRLANDYHLLFADWHGSIRRQAEVLDRLVRSALGSAPVSILDGACGIGTQAIGLALRGHQVHATDLSPVAVARARCEAVALGAKLSFGVADLRSLAANIDGSFDVVLACDNALPHLLSDADLFQALRNMAAVLRRGSLFLASIRDYDRLLQDPPRTDSLRVIDDHDGRRIVFQVWNWWDDHRGYRLHQFLVRQHDEAWRTDQISTEYRALLRANLAAAVRQAGLAEIAWHPPEATGYYQPIVTARKR